jgi:hypothetical protein
MPRAECWNQAKKMQTHNHGNRRHDRVGVASSREQPADQGNGDALGHHGKPVGAATKRVGSVASRGRQVASRPIKSVGNAKPDHCDQQHQERRHAARWARDGGAAVQPHSAAKPATITVVNAMPRRRSAIKGVVDIDFTSRLVRTGGYGRVGVCPRRGGQLADTAFEKTFAVVIS